MPCLSSRKKREGRGRERERGGTEGD